MATTTKKKRCPKCTLTLPVAAFSRNVTSSDGLQGWCRECNRAAAQTRLARNRARNLERYAAEDAVEGAALTEDASADAGR